MRALNVFLVEHGGYERSKGGLGGSSLITVRNLAFARFWYNNNYTLIIIK